MVFSDKSSDHEGPKLNQLMDISECNESSECGNRDRRGSSFNSNFELLN